MNWASIIAQLNEDLGADVPTEPVSQAGHHTDNAKAYLRETFPHGHQDFIPLTVEEMRLHSEKNHDYAFGGHPLGNFFRVGKILGNYPGLDLSDPAIVAMVYAMKQVDAYLWMKAKGYNGKIEGKTSRLQDVSVYTKLAIIIENEGKN